MAIKGRAQKTLTKIFDGSGVFSIIITNENTSIPISNQGLALNYSATPTDAYVYSGTSILTPVKSNPEAGQYTISVDGENITPGIVSMNGNHASIGNASNMVSNKDSYSINITASGKDFLGNPFTSQKKQVITPLKRGDDATSYWLNVTSSVITKDVKNNMTPSDVTVSSVAQSGFSDPREYSAIFKVYYKTGIEFSSTPSYTSSSPETSYKITTDSNVNDIKIEMYDEGNTNLLDVQTVPVISQANGVISTKIVYTVTNTAVQPNDSANWSDTMPTVGKGQYLWTKTTFYYTDGSNAVAYSLGSVGKDGSSASLLTLVSDSQVFTFKSDNVTPSPASQVINFVANLQNVTGTATFVATPYLGSAAGTPIVLGGTGNARTLTVDQFGKSYDSVVVKATLGALSDTETIHKLKDGYDGTDGKNGTNGVQGPKGADGKSSYVHIAYANSADGSKDFSTSVFSGKSFIGIYTDEIESDSTDYKNYTWSLAKGEDGKDGSDGLPGPKGADGISTYVHFAYANSSDGSKDFSTTDYVGRSYIGNLTDTIQADSTDYNKYTWSLVKGADGKDSLSGWLTNEAITIQADSNGNVPNFSTAKGTFVVYNGTSPVTGLTITQSNATGMTVSITGMDYSVTGMSQDSGYVDLIAKTAGVTITKRLTVAKSKAGATGENGTSVVNSTTPPKNPDEGQWWNDLSVTPNILKVYQKGQWIPYRIDAINLVANSITTDQLASSVLKANNIIYTNSNGTTTNLQTFDFDGIKTLLTDTNGNTYSNMESAVGSTKVVSSLQNKTNTLGQVNLINNSDFRPDLGGWTQNNNGANGNYTTGDYDYSGGVYVLESTATGMARTNSSPIPINSLSPVSFSFNFYIFTLPSGGSVYSQLTYLDASYNEINGSGYYPGVTNLASGNSTGKWINRTVNNLSFTPPANAKYIVFSFDVRGKGTKAGFNRPILVKSSSVGDYVPGQYNNNERILKIEETADKYQISIGKAQETADTANGKIDSLSIGGRNLLLTSSTMGNTSVWASPSIKVGETYQGMNISANTVAWAGPKYRISDLYSRSVINENDTYTYSAFVRNTSDTDIEIGFYGTNNTTTFTDPNGILITKMKAHTDWTRLSVTFKFKNLSKLDTTSIRFEPRYNVSNGYVNQSGFKLEKGSIFTDWTPAPEDVNSDIANVQSSTNQLLNTNLVVNSEFDNTTGNYTGWHLDNPWGTTVTSQINKHGNRTTADSGPNLYPQGSQMVNHDWSSSTNWIYSDPIPIGAGQPLSGSVTNANPTGSTTNVGLALYITSYDSNKNKLSGPYAVNLTTVHSNWVVNYFENKATPANTAYVSFTLGWNNGKAYFGQPMLQASSKYTGYIPGTPNSNMAIANAQSTATSAQTSADTANQNLANASKSGIRYIRLRSEGNNDNASTHFSEIKAFNSVGTNVLKGKPALLVNGATNSQGVNNATDENYGSYIDLGDMRNSEKYVMFDMGVLRYDVNSVQISTWTSTRTYYAVVAQTSSDGVSWNTIYRGNITPSQLIGGVSSTVISFGMDTSTVLKLTADNYTLGIDANGNLVSGISGNTQQVTLKGNVIHLDGNTIMDQNFFSLWNGQYGSTTIDATGMEVKTGKSKTKFTNGNMQFITDLGENIGYIGRQVDSAHTNLDYLTFGLNGWHTTYPGDEHYDDTGSNTDEYYGGDGILFGISNADGGYAPLLQWNSSLAASYRSSISGWLFTQPIVGGIDIYGDASASNNTVSMRFQNVKMSNGFTYPIMTSQQSAGSTGIVIGSGNTYILGGNSFVWSAAGNGYAYYNTQKRGSGGSSLLMASDGAIIAQSSATKYKADIQYEPDTSYGDKLLTIDPATWTDKNEKEQIKNYNATGQEPEYSMNKDGARYYGLIAEDMVKAGLEDLIVRNTEDGSVEGIQYEKIGIALIPLLREQRNQINEMRVEIERLKEKSNE